MHDETQCISNQDCGTDRHAADIRFRKWHKDEEDKACARELGGSSSSLLSVIAAQQHTWLLHIKSFRRMITS